MTVLAVALIALGVMGTSASALAQPESDSSHLAATYSTGGGGSFDLTADNDAVEVLGTVTFNSDGSATVKTDGEDNKADGLGPYVKIEWYTPSENYTYKSCSVGANGVCPMPTFTTPNSPKVLQLLVTAAAGSRGNATYAGQGKMFTRK